MQSSKFNFATVLSIIVLLVFSYITFLGLVYWQDGDFAVAGTLTAILFVLGVFSVYFLTASAESRWGNVRLYGQIGFGSITFILLMLASFPFTNFLTVSSDSELLEKEITEIRDAAIAMDSAYNAYVTNRADSFRIALNKIATNKDENYRACIEGASGATNDEKINAVVTSLRNRLLPVTAAQTIQARHEWLKESCNVNAWNPHTPSNLAKIGSSVAAWKDDYTKMSQVSYKGEPNAGGSIGFVYDKFSAELKDLNEKYSSFGSFNIISLICALVSFGFIMLPFLVKERDVAGDSRKKDGGNLFNKREY